MGKLLLQGRNLSKDFPAGRGKKVSAVSDISIRIHEGETLGLVGESGCGKSTLGRLLLGLIRPDQGEVLFKGENLSVMTEKDFRQIRPRLQLIFQDPYASLDPRMSVHDLIAEPLRTWDVCPTKKEVTERVLELMEAVGIPGEFLYRYPHQFSGGQRQRIGIARAIALNPDLIVCDEPVSALDVSVQNQILNLMNELQSARSLTYLFISHDLSVIRHIADRVGVMFLGKLCETGPTEAVYTKPRHPYTRFLLNSVPNPDPGTRGEEALLLTGEMPSPIDPPSGCRFRTRCPYATEICAAKEPEITGADGREIWCHHPLQ